MKHFLIFCLAGLSIAVDGQDITSGLRIARATSPIRIDGALDEPDWQAAAVADSFRYNFPVDTGYSRFPTEVRLTFDDRYLYIGAVCWQNRKITPFRA